MARDGTTTNTARADELLAAAREVISATPFCSANTLSQDGGVNVRIVGPIPGTPGDEDWTIWFSTRGSSRKAADIRRTGRVTLGYQRASDQSYVALIGRAAVFEDRREIRRRWLEAWRLYYPAGPEDPDLVFVKINVERMELCVNGVTPEPFGTRYSVLERGAPGEWRVVSD